MAVWYEVEKTEKGIENFLESNWAFHDFKMQYFNYDIANNKVDIFLKYDTGDEGVHLRFVRIDSLCVSTERDWDIDWIGGSSMAIIDNNFIWLDSEDWRKEDADNINKYTTWVKSELVFWAITDGDGNEVEMPEDRIHQIFEELHGERLEVFFDLKAFDGNWQDILSPKWIY